MQPVGIALRNVVVQSPILLVWLAGFVVALLRWRRHPTVSLLTVIAIVVYFVAAFSGTVASQWLFVATRNLGWAVPSWLVTSIAGFVLALLKALAWGLLLAAVFGWRAQ